MNQAKESPKRVLPITHWTYDKLCEIQAFNGIPFKIWAESELIKSILRVLGCKKNKPQKETPNDSGG